MRDNKLPGDYTDGETPDPIPNSEAKPAQADGSRFAARVGHRQDYEGQLGNKLALSLCAGYVTMPNRWGKPHPLSVVWVFI